MSHDVVSLFLDNVLILLLVSLISWFVLRPYFDPKRRNLPPGPTGLPVVGYAPFLPSDYEAKVKELYAKYGKIFSMRLGSSFEVMKQITKQDVFNHRPDYFIFGSFGVPNLGSSEY